MKDILEKHRSEMARLIFRDFDETEFIRHQQKEAEDLRKPIRLTKEEAEQSKKQTRLAIEEAKRLRKILEANGWLNKRRSHLWLLLLLSCHTLLSFPLYSSHVIS